MKSLKYEGMVKLKIFWRLRRLEAGLSGFKSKRVHYGKFGLQIILNHLISPQPNAPSLLPYQQNRQPPPPFFKSRRPPSPTSPFFLAHFLPSPTHLSATPSPKSFFISFHLLLFSTNPWSKGPICGCVCVVRVLLFRRRRAFFRRRNWFLKVSDSFLRFYVVSFMFPTSLLIFLLLFFHCSVNHLGGSVFPAV